MLNKQVVSLFLLKKQGNANNLHSDGIVLKSYEMQIAKWEGENKISLVSKTELSSLTTRKHYGILYRELLKLPNIQII